MKKKAITVALLLLLLNNNNFPNNKEIEISHKNSITEHIIETKKELEANSTSLALIKKYKLKGEFKKRDILKIRLICAKLDIQEEWVYKLFYLESRGNPKAINNHSGATGLIQIMPSTAKNLNTSTEEIFNMSISEQLDLVYMYLTKIKGNRTFNSFLDLYFAVFYPAAINKSSDYVLGKDEVQAKKIAKYNKGIDKAGNNDGIITVADVAKWAS